MDLFVSFLPAVGVVVVLLFAVGLILDVVYEGWVPFAASSVLVTMFICQMYSDPMSSSAFIVFFISSACCGLSALYCLILMVRAKLQCRAVSQRKLQFDKLDILSKRNSQLQEELKQTAISAQQAQELASLEELTRSYERLTVLAGLAKKLCEADSTFLRDLQSKGCFDQVEWPALCVALGDISRKCELAPSIGSMSLSLLGSSIDLVGQAHYAVADSLLRMTDSSHELDRAALSFLFDVLKLVWDGASQCVAIEMSLSRRPTK